MTAIAIERHGEVAELVVDVPNASVNTISSSVTTEFSERLDEVAADGSIRALVLVSGKPEHFIAGADIEEFVSLGSQEEAERLSRAGQALVDRVTRFSKPVVAAIHGACLGGGLELALGCHYRVASAATATKLGLPEVTLGLIPGAGGCQRLPRLVGVRAALDLIVPGRSVDGTRARRMGLVDECVPAAILREVATGAATRLAAGWSPSRPRPAGLAAAFLDRNALGRRLVYWKARRQIHDRTGGHYPAPLAAVEAVEHGLSHGMRAGLAREAELFGKLSVGPVSRNLVHLYFATIGLKKDAGADADPSTVTPIRRLGVVGAGFMGTGIAGVAALRARVDVRLRDTNLDRVAKGIEDARSVLDEQRRRRRLDRHTHHRLSALVSGGVDLRGYGSTDLVIEAVFEDLAVKRSVFAELETVVRDSCILASNTSTIPISRLQDGARHPNRMLGMHFFSPVAKLPLLEVIRGRETSDAAIVAAVRFGRAMGKTVIVLNDAPGFWVNRILAPYLSEAVRLLTEGVSIEAIDTAMTRFGFPVGPITLLDEVGLDVAAKGSAVLRDAFGDRLVLPPVVERLVAEDRLGRKTGRGFHRYVHGQKRGVDPAVYTLMGVSPGRRTPTEELESRLVLPLLNEAARALADGVVRSARDGDIGAIFGCGFPAFRGGPLRYVDQRGASTVVARLETLAARHGDRFRPAEPLVAMARNNATFHP